MKELSGVFERDQAHSHWGIDLLSYEKKLNNKVRMTVAIPTEHKGKVDDSAYRRIKKMSFKCLDKSHNIGRNQGFIDDCKDEVNIYAYMFFKHNVYKLSIF